MSVVQLADLRDESARRAWGDELLTAEAVLGYMSEKAIGVQNAKLADDISEGATLWANMHGPVGSRVAPSVPRVLHCLAQGAACSSLRVVGSSPRFYLHHDYTLRLRVEREAAENLAASLAGPRVMYPPCLTAGCPYLGTRDQLPSVDSVFPRGPKCCGSCTGKRRDGQPMALAHGSCCERQPWLGVPEIDTRSTEWLSLMSASQLNEELNKAKGTVSLVQKDINSRVAGVSIEWATHDRQYSTTVHYCRATLRKDEGHGQWTVCMSGPTKSIAKLRATMAVLHCYKTLLEAAEKNKPVDYDLEWLAAESELNSLAETHALKVELTGGLPLVSSQQASMSAGATCLRDSSHSEDDASDSSFEHIEIVAKPLPSATAAAGQPVPNIWAGAPPPPPPPHLNVNRAMCAVARYKVRVFALPHQQTIPATHIVPLSSLREALCRNRQTRMVNWEAYSDEYLADRFAALSTPADTAEPRHGGVPRFRRSQVDVSVMRPANPESEASIQRVGEPCLVVRMKSEFARTAY